MASNTSECSAAGYGWAAAGLPLYAGGFIESTNYSDPLGADCREYRHWKNGWWKFIFQATERLKEVRDGR